ncbi:hypothetical protein DH2020_045681 [Rehmannia glutinosa]|uniref:Uncharacterized protein n=1 Tax=Rehmannia glutinosa TaxID=99300 RepID=A0ABR0UEF6_REHGL
MSTTPPPPPPPLTSIYTAGKSASVSHNLSSVGLGYAIAIALGFLVLFSTIAKRKLGKRHRLLDLLVRVQGGGDAADVAGLQALFSRDVCGRVAEAQRVVSCVSELAAAYAAVDAIAGGGAALSVLRWAETMTDG